MAKSKRVASKAAHVENAGSKAPEGGHVGGATVTNSGKKNEDSVTEQANKAEEKAAKKGEENPNAVKNPYAKGMTTEEAEAVVKKYDGINGVETPPELEQARKVLRKSKS